MLSGCAISQVKNRSIKPCFANWNTLLLVTSHSSFMVPVFFAPEPWHNALFLWVPDSVCLIQLSGTPEAGAQDTWAAELVKFL